MNERIRQLSDIAYANHLKNNPNSSFGRRSDYDKEFAELIVKECSAYVEGTGNWLVAMEMKQYFGVEE